MQYIGIDLAWSEHNTSGVALIENGKLIYANTLIGLENIINFIKKYPNAIVGIDAPLKIENETGNRDIEKQFLKDFSKYKLGVYPINKNLLLKTCKILAGVEVQKAIPQKLGVTLFEVYPHATILKCFNNNKVLPYKAKKGRDTQFIKSQLKILHGYLNNVIDMDLDISFEELKGKKIKDCEDILDAITCAYTLMYCEKNPCKIYGEIFKVAL